MIKAVFLDEGSVNNRDLDLEPLLGMSFDWQVFAETNLAERRTRLDGVSIAIINKVPVDDGIMKEATQLRLICVAATGTDNVDLDAAARYGILVCNVRDYATATVTEHVFALILALSRNLPAYRNIIETGAWQRSRHFCVLTEPINELRGRTLGIIGYGNIGRSVAGVGRAMGMNIRVAARPGSKAVAERVDLYDLLTEVDVLSLHCPLADNTRGLIAGRELRLMRQTALLINTARGGIVDELALAQAIRDGRLGGAGVDVLTMEPPHEHNPLLTVKSQRLIVTPHIAWASRDARQRLIDELALNIAAFLDGKPRNRVA